MVAGGEECNGWSGTPWLPSSGGAEELGILWRHVMVQYEACNPSTKGGGHLHTVTHVCNALHAVQGGEVVGEKIMPQTGAHFPKTHSADIAVFFRSATRTAHPILAPGVGGVHNCMLPPLPTFIRRFCTSLVLVLYPNMQAPLPANLLHHLKLQVTWHCQKLHSRQYRLAAFGQSVTQNLARSNQCVVIIMIIIPSACHAL